MTVEDPDSKTRRRFLATTGTAAVLGLAGCTGSDDSDEDGNDEQESSTAAEQSSSDSDDTDEETGGGSVTLLVESVGGGGHDHEEGDHEGEDEHDHEKEGEQHSYEQEGLTDSEISHACNHLEEVEEFGAEEVEAGATADESPQLSETHHPYSVSVENEAGYVLFEMEGHSEDEHDHEEGSGEMLTFMTENGSADVERGTLVYRETDEVAACGPMDRYVVVEPNHGEAVVELSTEL